MSAVREDMIGRHGIAQGRGRLLIGQYFEPPACPAGHELLLGFDFSGSLASQDTPGWVSVDLPPFAESPGLEAWWYGGEVSRQDIGRVRHSHCEDFGVACLQIRDTGEKPMQQLTREAYAELLDCLDRKEHNRIARFWNYFGAINSGAGDEERYRQFSIGRAAAFADFGISKLEVPPATAVGTASGNTLTIIALVTNRGLETMSNPRQVDAFEYPPEYGPVSPSFSRAGQLSGRDQNILFISGTSSIVGHGTTHARNTESQLAETLRNLDSLVAQLGSGAQAAVFEPRTDGLGAIRVYVRKAEDQARVVKILRGFFDASLPQPMVLQADICRDDLMVEIECTQILPVDLKRD